MSVGRVWTPDSNQPYAREQTGSSPPIQSHRNYIILSTRANLRLFLIRPRKKQGSKTRPEKTPKTPQSERSGLHFMKKGKRALVCPRSQLRAGVNATPTPHTLIYLSVDTPGVDICMCLPHVRSCSNPLVIRSFYFPRDTNAFFFFWHGRQVVNT